MLGRHNQSMEVVVVVKFDRKQSEFGIPVRTVETREGKGDIYKFADFFDLLTEFLEGYDEETEAGQ